MSSDKQSFGIKVIDHRVEGDDPEVTFHRFSNHRKYLNKVKELTATPPGTAVFERTWTKLTIANTSPTQDLFDQ